MAAKVDVLTIAQLIISIATVAAIILAIREYHKGQKWRKAQFLLSLINSFENNKRIKLACQMLDWDERDVILDEYSSLLQFKSDMLIAALRVVPMDTKKEFSPEHEIIRDAFDAFFDFFERLYALERSGLLTLTDYTYFYYWFDVLENIGEWKDNQAIQEAIRKYIEEYGFIGIQYLLKKYEKIKKRKHSTKLRWKEMVSQ